MDKKITIGGYACGSLLSLLRSFMFLLGGSCPANCIGIIYDSFREKEQKMQGFEIFAKACPSEI